MRKTRLVLMGVAIVLGHLFLSLGDRVAGSDETLRPFTSIRVEDRRGFTRIVFPGHPSKESSVEPDLDKHRFIVRFPGVASEITPPRLAKDQHLIKGVEILPDSAKRVLVQVVLTNGPLDRVCYRYQNPPRTVLYLRARSGSTPSRASPSSLPVSQKTESAKAKKPKSPRKAQPNPLVQTEESVDLAKSHRVKRDEEGVEDLWRPSARDISEFIRLGSVYAPDFHDMKENERRLYQQALESFRNRNFSRAKELLGESLAELAAYCDDQGKMSRAIQYHRRIVRLSPSEDRVDWALYRLGESYRKAGDLEMMRRAFEDLDKRSSDSLWAKLAKGAAGDAAFEAKVEPHLAQVRRTLMETKKT